MRECVKVAKNVDILYLEFSISVQNANSRDIVSNQPENYSFGPGHFFYFAFSQTSLLFISPPRKHQPRLYNGKANAKLGVGLWHESALMKGCHVGNLLAISAEQGRSDLTMMLKYLPGVSS